ncbi:helicase-related protein [Lacticaseibacillus hulanensis]|uniref:helicase-related protein n=1 Tax=Lacticaseibacillus hulanensis TaxID=2493111 RepID=UPI001F4ED207|nr:helicase-related protein [Lacticaseibacillus hulanensis]
MMSSKVSRTRQSIVRNKYLDGVLQEIIGPGSEMISRDAEHEVISEPPRTRYVTGILFHNRDKSDAQNDNQTDIGSGQDDFDPESDPIVVDNGFNPTSIGLSFYCNEVNQIRVIVKAAKYERIINPKIDLPDNLMSAFKERIHANGLSDVVEIDEENNNFSYKKRFETSPSELEEGLDRFLKNTEKKLGQRPDFEADPVYFYLSHLREINRVENKSENKTHACFQRFPISTTVIVDLTKSTSHVEVLFDGEPTGLRLFAKVIRPNLSGVIAPTIVLQNNSNHEYYQCELSVEANRQFRFIASEDVSLPDIDNLQEEDAKLLFAYQNRKTYAFGHGVSATWEPLNIVDSDEGPAVIRTSYVPCFDLTPMKFTIDGIDDDILRPDSYLKEVAKSDQLTRLRMFVTKYRKWIDEREIEAKLYTHRKRRFEDFAKDNLTKCRACASRMENAIEEMEDNPLLLKAFDLANEAILLQRIQDRTEKTQCYQNRNYQSIQDNKSRFLWRPFQLAFILTTLTSIVNPTDPNRSDLDLIWVATGGGKTEAYLFAIAVSVLYQRLNDSEAFGVNVIMRYTLRLLTAQQFDRACALICALEYMRTHTQGIRLGTHPISIGLWVGKDSTPNDVNDVKDKFSKMRTEHGPNVFQVLRCPWCHKEDSLVPADNDRENSTKWGYYPSVNARLHYDMCCLNPDCEFKQSLPVYVVDTTIYAEQPTLLFGTVDKFAQVPINDKTGAFFHAISDDGLKTYTPQLVIQDELHLISGPLGSIVGLYEAGFDYVMASEGIQPKYLASTATIRNSRDQISNLYGRGVIQFPPDGLLADDSFFVTPDVREANEPNLGRRYVGIMGSGKSQVTTEVRVFASMLSTIAYLDIPDAEKELFWTCVGYFNSIRELGKASSLIVDDVQDEIRRIARRRGRSIRWISNNVELTSRISSNKISQTLDELSITYEDKNRVVDTVIATNMLSVGIDIARLNTMLVVGQPKLTSEYIQATSRVGRNTLGVVFTLYNSVRSRDRSHYESFTGYHQSMYRYVEPSSVTPFSQPALKKALAAALVTMLRYTVPDMEGDDGAVKILDHLDEVNKVSEVMLARIRLNDPNHLYATRARYLLNEFISQWTEQANDVRELGVDKLFYYRRRRAEPNTQYLLVPYDNTITDGETPVMNTMRDIEDVTNLQVKGNVGDDSK